MKTLHFQIADELHKELRVKAIQEDKSIKQYVTELIQKAVITKKEQTQ